MDYGSLLESVEQTMTTKFRQSATIRHAGDRGEQREADLRQFLGEHLPRRFGIAKGEVLSPGGTHSYAADIIIYDAANCPLIFNGHTQIIPIEGVYGVIEVKSRLSKAELLDSLSKITSFKAIPLPGMAAHPPVGREVQFYRTSDPFGIVFAYDFAENSLESLVLNWREQMEHVPFQQYANFLTVLGGGIVQIEMVHKTSHEHKPLIDSKLLWQQMMKKQREPEYEFDLAVSSVRTGPRTFGRFFVYLASMLHQMRLGTPDLLAYLDPELPMPFDVRIITHGDPDRPVEILCDASFGDLKVILPPANEY